jgi:hypothetical protein
MDLTPSPNPLPLSAAERGRGPGGRREVESNIVEIETGRFAYLNNCGSP